MDFLLWTWDGGKARALQGVLVGEAGRVPRIVPGGFSTRCDPGAGMLCAHPTAPCWELPRRLISGVVLDPKEGEGGLAPRGASPPPGAVVLSRRGPLAAFL